MNAKTLNAKRRNKIAALITGRGWRHKELARQLRDCGHTDIESHNIYALISGAWEPAPIIKRAIAEILEVNVDDIF